MLLAAALMLGLFGQPKQPLPPGASPLARAARAHTHVGPWRITFAQDRFTGAITCKISAPDISLRRETLIFRLGRGLETTHADFRLDRGPSRPVSTAFAEVEDHGFFPERGWIIDPQGGEVALPAGYVRSARTISLSVGPGRRARTFKVGRLIEAIIEARAAGCQAPGA
jgi:hypothetical protein